MDFLIYLLLLLADILIGMYYYKKLSKAFQYLTQLILVTFLFELSSESLILSHSISSNFPFYHVLLPVQLLYSGLIYSLLLQEINQNRKYLLPVTFLLATVIVLISMFHQNWFSFPTYGSLILSLFITVNSLFLYFKLMEFPTDTPILRQSFFWINSGNFLFYTATFFVFGYFEYAQGSEHITPAWISILIKMFNFMLYGSCGIALYFNALNFKSGNYQLK